jgi:hypothetical protein
MLLADAAQHHAQPRAKKDIVQNTLDWPGVGVATPNVAVPQRWKR